MLGWLGRVVEVADGSRRLTGGSDVMPLNTTQRAVLAKAKLRGTLDDWCRANWERVPEKARRACIDLLRARLPAAAVDLMRLQHERGMRIGSHDPGFHLYYGLMIRNILRAVLRDDELPEVVQLKGGVTRNWDDFYTGALEALVEETDGKN